MMASWYEMQRPRRDDTVYLVGSERYPMPAEVEQLSTEVKGSMANVTAMGKLRGFFKEHKVQIAKIACMAGFVGALSFSLVNVINAQNESYDVWQKNKPQTQVVVGKDPDGNYVSMTPEQIYAKEKADAEANMQIYQNIGNSDQKTM